MRLSQVFTLGFLDAIYDLLLRRPSLRLEVFYKSLYTREKAVKCCGTQQGTVVS
jgi:hypothetical protein